MQDSDSPRTFCCSHRDSFLDGDFVLSYSVIMRTIIDLPDYQITALGKLCAREKISRAEAVRRALDAMLIEKMGRDRESAYGAWSPRRDSRALVKSQRDEWA